MAKDERRECPDCRGPDLGHFSIFSKGDGKCSQCRGEGQYTDMSDVVGSLGTFGMVKDHHSCEVCSGTGQCQTCGGTGYQYYYEEGDVREEESRNIESYPDSYSSSESYSGSDTDYSATSDDSDSGFCSILGIFGVMVIFGIGYALYTYSSCNRSPETRTQNNIQEASAPLVKECESANTGSYLFKNKTARTIFLFLDRGTEYRKIEVGPKSVFAETDLSADEEYHYTYSYYNGSNFNNNDRHGEIVVEKCKEKVLNLILPPAYWYNLKFDVWKRIPIPREGSYLIVAPYMSFSIRFSENDIEHSGNSYALLPAGTTEIYLKSNSEKGIEVSIQPYFPR